MELDGNQIGNIPGNISQNDIISAVNELIDAINQRAANDLGGYHPVTMADTDAAKNTIYYSSDGNKLSYKDAGGTIHDLY